MEFTPEQTDFIRKKLSQFFLDYSVRHAKNVVYKYCLGSMNTATVGLQNWTPNVEEFIGVLKEI